jgi:hypothetical protein
MATDTDKVGKERMERYEKRKSKKTEDVPEEIPKDARIMRVMQKIEGQGDWEEKIIYLKPKKDRR